VIYAKGGKLHRATASGVVMANGAWSSQCIVADLGEEYREAFQDFVRAPILVMNVALRRWRALYDLGITAASYRDRIGFCCNLRQSMVAGDYRPPLHPDKPTVLTFYVPFERPGAPLREQASSARYELLTKTYREYETAIREQLTRLFARGGFDAREDVAAIVLNRWGHAYVCPPRASTSAGAASLAAADVLRRPPVGWPSRTRSCTATRTGSMPPPRASAPSSSCSRGSCPKTSASSSGSAPGS
jgi:spermidine dehydrogenase